jgi:hypothetical protein
MKFLKLVTTAAALTAVMAVSAGAQQAGRADPPANPHGSAPGLQMRISKQLPNNKQTAAQQKQRLMQAMAASAQRRAAAEARKEQSRPE